MPYRYNIEMNFVEDYLNFCRLRLEEKGYKLKSNKDADYKLFNLQKRIIIPKKRNVLISKEFNCPEYLKKGLEILKEKIKEGKDITSHLSKKISNLDYNDDLLNDWGIYHLHLGEKYESNGNFAERTGLLLFARFDDENAYFINIYKHGSWSKQEMVRILHNNWSKSIEQFKTPFESTTRFSDKQYSAMRKSHLYTFIEVEKNAVYMPIGVGYMSSGHSTEVIELCDRNWNLLKEFEIYIKQKIGEIVKETEKKKGSSIGNRFKFFLWLENSQALAYEFKNGIEIELGAF